MTDWLDSEDFPSGPGGGTVDQYSTWIHPVTKVVYFWDSNKNSWMTLNSPGAKMYVDTVDPGLGSTLQDGDLWWDSHHCELRVFHNPLPVTADQYVEGRWVSSTNPEMTPEDVNRNMIIGTIEISGPMSPQEDEEVEYRVTRPYGGAPDSKIDYQWRVAPSSITLYAGTPNETIIDVVVNNPTLAKTTMIFPEGTYQVDGNSQFKFNVSCKITAKDEFVDEFVTPSATSPSIAVRPLPKDGDPVNALNIIETRDSNNSIIYGFTPRSYGIQVSNNNGEYSTDVLRLTPFFVVVPDIGVSNSTGLTFSKKPKDESSANDILSEYVTDMSVVGSTEGSSENVTGYVVQLSSLSFSKNNTIYVYDDQGDYEGTLILTI